MARTLRDTVPITGSPRDRLVHDEPAGPVPQHGILRRRSQEHDIQTVVAQSGPLPDGIAAGLYRVVDSAGGVGLVRIEDFRDRSRSAPGQLTGTEPRDCYSVQDGTRTVFFIRLATDRPRPATDRLAADTFAAGF